MGGTFSGYKGAKKRVVESCNSIDTADLNRLRLFVPGTNRSGSLEWRREGEREPSSSVGYAITVGGTDGTLRLQYQFGHPAERLDYTVRLVTTGCHLGGARWWFVCPLAKDGAPCGRRVRKLYRSGRYFGCRRCHNLTYRSTQESDSRVYAALRTGLDLDAIHTPGRMSVSQLGFALKVLTFEQKRLDRLGKRLDRVGSRKRVKRAVENC